jgi:dynein light chain Tctex-type 1
MSNSEVDDTAFVVEEVCAIIQDSIASVIGEKAQFAEIKVGPWTNNIVEGCVAKLTALHKPFKYIATCLIMQRTGAGLIKASACFWDRCTDGACTIR